MKNRLLFLILLLQYSPSFSQSITELFRKGEFGALTKYENKYESLADSELYMVGFAFFRTGNDASALKFYDLSIKKGFTNSVVYFYKGLSLLYTEKFDDALKEMNHALENAPDNQEYLSGKAEIYYTIGKKDSALILFKKAASLPLSFPDCFYWVAKIYLEKDELDSSLKWYYAAVKNMPKNNGYYSTCLLSIGSLEFSHTKNYTKSLAVFQKALELEPDNYDMYIKFMKCYNENKQYHQADSIFSIVQTLYKSGKIPEKLTRNKMILFDEYELNGQIILVHKRLETPEKLLDAYYKGYLISKTHDKIEREFVLEKTAEEIEGIKYIFCENVRDKFDHITYSLGWKTEQVPITEFKQAVNAAISGELTPGAATKFNFGK